MHIPSFLRSQYECLRFAAGWVGIVWIVYAISLVLPLTDAGIVPRTARGLVGIFASPFLHANYQHLSANSVAMFGFLWLLLSLNFRRGVFVLALTWIMSGCGTWLIGGEQELHIGASGIIYALFGYLLVVGAVEKDLLSVLVSLVVAALYGSAIWGVLPLSDVVSWESHLSGFISGILTAVLVKRASRIT